MEYIDPDSAGRLDSIKGLTKRDAEGYGIKDTEKIRPVSLKTIEDTIKYLNPTVAAMVRVQYLCGMRPGEVCGMRWIDIDRDADPTGKVWIYVPAEHKGTWRGQRLMKAIPRTAQKALEPFQRASEEEYVFQPREVMQALRDAQRLNEKHPDRPNRLNEHFGEKYSTQSYGHAIRDAIKKAKREGLQIPHWSPNQLRHTIGTEVEARYGREASGKYLGHVDLDTTAIYAERTVRELIGLADRLDSELFRSTEERAQGL